MRVRSYVGIGTALFLPLLMPLLMLVFLLPAGGARAHHTLGINQAGKATESPQIPAAFELHVEPFLVSLAVLPDRPAVGQTTRLIAYVKDTQTLKPFLGEIEFRVAEMGWFGEAAPLLEKRKQPIDDRYIQDLTFPEGGTYAIQLAFSAAGRNFTPSFTLKVGEATPLWKVLLGVCAVLLFGAVAWKAAKNRRRLRPV